MYVCVSYYMCGVRVSYRMCECVLSYVCACHIICVCMCPIMCVHVSYRMCVHVSYRMCVRVSYHMWVRTSYCMCVHVSYCMCVHVSYCTRVHVSYVDLRGPLARVSLSFNHMGPRDTARVLRLGPNLLGHLTGPTGGFKGNLT